MQKLTTTRLFAAALLAGAAFVAQDRGAAARVGIDPATCMNLALDYATTIVRNEQLDAVIAAHGANLDRMDALAEDQAKPPRTRYDEARALVRSREARDLDRDVRGAMRTLDNARSIVAGWRGNYCPVARPDRGEGLSGQARCDALAASFVDELRIERRTVEQANARERLTAERQTILKARITRSDRDDLLELWRLRSDGFETQLGLERLQTLRGSAVALIDELRASECVPAESDRS